jgi:ubiquinone biosynthesis protein UbiJ
MMTSGLLLLNHLLQHNPEVRADLSAFAGRRLALRAGPFSGSGVVTGAGWLAECQGEPEAWIQVRPLALLLAQSRQRPPAFADLTLGGEPPLAQALAALLGRLRWHVADDLARVFGSVAAHRLETAARQASAAQTRLFWRVLESWTEYLREETPLLAKKADVEDFVMAVDALRDDAERCAKRLRLLEARQPSSEPK